MVEVTLGGVTVQAIPQKHAYLKHRLGPAFKQAFESGQSISVDGFMEWAGDNAYDMLCVLIPTIRSRIPAYTFAGYASAEAQANGDYDETQDQSPSLPEIIEAFRVGLHVNGIDELMKLGKLIDGRILRAELNRQIARAITASPSSPSTSGESVSTTSSTTPPISTESADSPSAASTD